jgi:hypothetical protein
VAGGGWLCHLSRVAEIEDKVFVALARKVGYPAESELRRCRQLQLARRKREASPASLFATAISEGVLTLDQAHRFFRWADQVARRDTAPLTDAGPATGGATPATRVFHESAAELKMPVLCETCELVLDDEALGSGMAREVEGERLCNVCSPPSPRAGVPSALSKSAEHVLARVRASRAAPAPSVAPREPEPRAPVAGKPKRRVRELLVESAELLIRPLRRRGPRIGGSESAPVSRRGAVAAVAVAATTLVAAIAIAISVTYSREPEAAPPATVVEVPAAPGEPPSAPPPPPPPGFNPSGGGEPASAPSPATPVIARASALERAGEEGQAVLALDVALARTRDPAEATRLREAREGMLSRARARLVAGMAEVGRLKTQHRQAEADAALGQLLAHLPKALQKELDAAYARLTSPIAPRSNDEPRTAPEDDPGKAPARAEALRREESERLGRAREALDRALVALDLPAARAALDRAGEITDRELALDLALDRGRCSAIERLLRSTRAAFARDVKSPVDLECRVGRLTGKLTLFQADRLTVQSSNGSVREVTLAELAVDALLAAAQRGAGKDMPAYFFGRGVLLQVNGDRTGAIDALRQAPGIAAAARLLSRLEAEEAAARVAGPAAGAPTAPLAPSTPLAEPPPAPAPDPEAKPHESWLDDTSGAVDWEEARTLETDHYLIKSDIRWDYVKRYGRILEALADRYTVLFDFGGNDFQFKKNEVFIYRDQAEFRSKEGAPEDLGGQYSPRSKRLVTFHGPWGNRRTTTLGILAHEAAHQFQNLRVRELDHAPTFLIEGLATFFESTEVKASGEVVIGRIPEQRLAALQRDLRSGACGHLRDLIRLKTFAASDYPPAWGLIYWLTYGPEKKKGPQLLQAYWERCTVRPTTAEDFETAVADAGYTMESLETSWKAWILALDPKKDPADARPKDPKKK